MKMKKKRIISILLSLTLVLGIIPLMSMTSHAEEYNLKINNKVVDDSNASDVLEDGGTVQVSSDANNIIVTLNGASLDTVSSGLNNACIDYTGNSKKLKIVLKGNNTIECNTAVYGIYSDPSNPYIGIYIEGDGSLEIKGTNVGISGNEVTISSGTITASTTTYAIASHNLLTINGGTVNVTSDNTPINAGLGRLIINGGTVEATSNSSRAIYATQTLEFNGGTVKAISKGDDDNSIGICSYDTEPHNYNTITINGGDVYAKGKVGIKVKDDVIIGGDVSSVTAIGTGSGANDKAIVGTVKNAIKGTGWTNAEGTEGKAEIVANTDPGQSLKYKKIQFPAYATITTKPTANTLTYTGSAQKLVTEGVAENGTMQYGLGTSATTAPTTWSDTVPSETEAGTYHVWYYAKGNDGYADSDKGVIDVTINPKEQPAKREVLDGAGQTVYYGDKARFRVDADYDLLFKTGGKVYVDDKELDTGNYEEGKGSTIITLKEAFIKSLTEGAHKIQVVFNDDSFSSTTFTVKKAEAQNKDNGSSTESGTATPTSTPTTTSKVTSPKTSDTIPIVAILILAIGIGTIGIAAYKKRD